MSRAAVTKSDAATPSTRETGCWSKRYAAQLALRPVRLRAAGVQAAMLQTERLTKHYGGLVAIQDLSFDVRPGEVLGLLGPNGSGKSTTVKILTGLLRQTRGDVLLDGRDAFTDLEAYKALIGY